MPDIEIDVVARDVAEGLSQLYGERLRRVVLFGSWARGEADEESDVDILVVLAEMESPFAEIRRMSELLWELTQRHSVVVSAVPVTERDFDDAPTAFLTRIRVEGRDAA